MGVMDDILKEVVPSEIKHYGVKGMKWGVRRKTFSGKAAARTTLARSTLKSATWAARASGQPMGQSEVYHQVYRGAASKIRQGTRALNRDPKYKNANFRKDSSLRKQYYDDYSKMVVQQLNASATRNGRSPDGRLQMKFSFDANTELSPKASITRVETLGARSQSRKEANTSIKGMKADTKAARQEVREAKKASKELSHDASSPDETTLFNVTLSIDETGHIVDMELDGVEHSNLRDEDYIEHYGVPGQRWGFRKATTRGGTPPSKRKRKADEGEDKKEAEAPKKKSAKDLTDAELREAINRVQLEKQYNQLTTPQKAESVVSSVLKTAGKQVATQVITQVGTAYLSKAVGVNLNKALPDAYKVTGKKGG